MSNANKFGYIDRRKPTPAQWIHVEDQFNKVYNGAPVYEKAKLEVEVYRSAYEHLDEEDKKVIKSFIDKYNSHDVAKTRQYGVRIKGFGEIAVLETCAKLGIWLKPIGVK